MTSGKFFNKGVMTTDTPHIGYVVRETDEKIVVFGEKDARFDIPKSAVKFVSKNVLVDLPAKELAKYKVPHDAPLPTDKEVIGPDSETVDLATYEGKYPKSLFNKGVRTEDEDHIGHVMMETNDMMVVYGHHDYRFDIPKSRIIAVGRNVIVDMKYADVFKYQVNRNAPLPTGEPVEKLAEYG
jgi:sporulation protein YlmC with PRC-barrel domain